MLPEGRALSLTGRKVSGSLSWDVVEGFRVKRADLHVYERAAATAAFMASSRDQANRQVSGCVTGTGTGKLIGTAPLIGINGSR